MKTILVPVDFGKNSTTACIYAIEMAKETGASVTLIHVYEKPVLLARSYKNALLAEAKNKMDALISKIRNIHADFETDQVILEGRPVEQVIRYANANKISLIVTGTTGYGPIARTLLGNPSLTVLRNAPCPVMTIPPQASFKGLKKIVYATDLSAASLRKAAAIVPLASLFNSEIVFLYISLILGKETNVEMQEVTKKIRTTVKYAKISGYVCDDLNADEGILFFLSKVKADCLILYAAQHTLMQKLFHRSVIKSLSLHTTLPLLVLHDEDTFPVRKIRTGSKLISRSDIKTAE